MAIRFSVLASGSRGNSTLIRAGEVGLLIDLGLTNKEFQARLAAVGSDWEKIRVAVLTHTHGDHIQKPALGLLARHGITLYCHEGHHRYLEREPGYERLYASGLVRFFEVGRPFLSPAGLQIEPIELSHDGGPTFGFRIEGRDSRRGPASTVGYLADTGCWSEETAEALTDVDLLGIEFNHDVELQRNSGRPWHLIARNLGKGGHLSNDQGAELLANVLHRSSPAALRHVVLLHLSDQCNRPRLALDAARTVVRERDRKVSVHAAQQEYPSPTSSFDLRNVPERSERRTDQAPGSSRGSPGKSTRPTSLTNRLFFDSSLRNRCGCCVLCQ